MDLGFVLFCLGCFIFCILVAFIVIRVFIWRKPSGTFHIDISDPEDIHCFLEMSEDLDKMANYSYLIFKVDDKMPKRNNIQS